MVLRLVESGAVRHFTNETITLLRRGGSAMPAGIAAGLSRQQLVDLLAFLSKLGSPGEFSVSQANLVRVWDTMTDAPKSLLAKGEQARRLAFDASLASSLWQRHYARVDGTIELGGYPGSLAGDLPASDTGLLLLRASVDVTHPGRVGLRLNDAAGLKLWRQGAAREVETEVTFEFETGRQTLFFLLDRRRRGDLGIRAEWVVAGDAKGRLREGPGILPR